MVIDTDLLRVQFETFVHPQGECEVWARATDKNGYGRVGLGGQKTALAHRAAWFLRHGVWPSGVLRHTCDNPPCVRIEHLIDGTQAQNMQDMLDRGRASPPPVTVGEASALSRLREDQVREIKQRLRAGGETQRAIAADYGVHRMAITHISTGRSWKHVVI